MAIDITQFHQVFLEESAEHLASMESLLLAIDLAEPDSEAVNAIFRAAHSIKGSASTFGFQEMAELTHEAEALLDRVRKHETRLNEDMLQALLEAGDVLKTLLAAHVGQGAGDIDGKNRLCARLRALAAHDAAPATPQHDYDVRFVVDTPDVDVVMENLLAELGKLGRVEVLDWPSVDDGDPSCRLRIAAADEGAIAELIEFVARDGSVVIAPLADFMTEVLEEGYGFFVDLPKLTASNGVAADDVAGDVTDDAFGLFDTAVPTPLSAHEEKAYGFFDVAPLAVSEPLVEAPALAPHFEHAASVEAARPAARTATDASIRVGIERVDQLVNLVGELVITQAMLTQAAARVDPVIHEKLLMGLAQLERNTRDLQESVMAIRMVPISAVFGRFPRLVHDISHKLGKEVELKLSGENTELDKGLVERLTDPLTHLVRNSLDHGIESPERRAAAGKPPCGVITLSAYHRGGNIVIEIGDDGGGLDRARILAKGRERGMAVSEAMSDQEVWAMIFEAGFSTADKVTDVSGRGVGMDVVKRNIAALGGRIEIESMHGIGTRMTVRMPLTLAILDGMSVETGDETYIVPLSYVVESLRPEPAMVKTMGRSRRVLQVRGEYLPVVSLADLFGIRPRATRIEQGIAVVVESDGVKIALQVDGLLGQQQVVIKSLEANYRRVPGVSGATILGDGHVGLILDVPALVDMGRAAQSEAA